MAQDAGNTNITPSIAKVGMNLDSSTREIAQGELSWAMSAVLDGYDGESVNYSNEPANELCCTIPDGFRVIGRLNIVELDKIVLWLANPDNGASEIGTVDNCVYTKIINDNCLNFHVDFPIMKAVYKHGNCGVEVYWVDKGRNNARYLQLENLPYKEVEGCVDEVSTEIDCNKLNIQPWFSIPQIDVKKALTGGNLKVGAYQFAIQYANALAEPYTSFYSVTNEAPAFDNTQPTQNFDFEVDKGFDLTIRDIDVSGIYDYINVAAIRTVNNITTVELIGTYQITGPTKSILYTGQVIKPLNIDDVFQRYEIFDKPKDITTAQDTLILAGISEEERISYQQIANKIELEWATVRLRGDDTYADAENASKYRSYMRDEVYPYEMVVKLHNGYISDGFHIPARVAEDFDLEEITNADVPQSLDECDTAVPSLPRWKVYNTATITGTLHPENPDECYEGQWQYGKFAYWESTETYDCNADIWGELAGKPIRHHKFPDSVITHIHDSKGYVYPIGVKINPQKIISLINQSDLTEEQKSKIQSISIFRGNRVNNSSVIAKGLVNNVLKYSTKNNIIDATTGQSGTSIGSSAEDSARRIVEDAYDYTHQGHIYSNQYAFTFLLGPIMVGHNYEQNKRYDDAEDLLDEVRESTNIFTQTNIDKLEETKELLLEIIDKSNGDMRGKAQSQAALALVEGAISIIEAQLQLLDDLADIDLSELSTETVEANDYMFFPNYLFNDLRVDGAGEPLDFFLDNTIIDEDAKQRWAFHSPDTHFYQPSISPGIEFKLETAEIGLSTGHIREVEKHAKYQFISSTGYITALIAGLSIGFASGTYGVAAVNVFDGTAMFQAYQTFLDVLYKTVPHKNYAYQFNAVGNYSTFVPVQNNGNKKRTTDIAVYASPGVLNVSDKYSLNNFQRESSVYLKTLSSLPFTHEIPGVPKDSSKIAAATFDALSLPISSYYASIKNNIPNQYGQMYSYETVDTGYTIKLTTAAPETDLIFGGDVFINRFAFKNKLPFFIDNRVGAPDGADIAYNELSNVGRVKYWFSTDVTPTSSVFDSLFATMTENFFWPKIQELYTSGMVFLFAYGIPYFFCESNVNVDLRQAYNQNEGDFYPRVSSGIPDKWLQEWYVSINNDNTYWYNKSFSKQNKETYISHLPSDYDFRECRTVFPYRAIFSEPEKTTENPSQRNNWRIFKPSSKFDFPQNYGMLTSLDGINDQQVLARFENKTLLYNALLTAPTSAAQVYLGKSLFSRDVPPLDLGNTDTGFIGSQHKFFLRIPYGAVSVDAKRGKIFLINGRNVEEISSEKYKCSRFFDQNLPFVLPKQISFIDPDNNFNGVGLHGVFDNKLNRLLLTKLDYELKDPTNVCYNGKVMHDLSPKQEIIDKWTAEGYRLKSFENCKLTFSKTIGTTILPRATDVYAFFDTTSMLPADGVAAAAALQLWFTQLKADNPNYGGSLYIVPSGIEPPPRDEAEQYLKYLSQIYTGNPFMEYHDNEWEEIRILPANFGTEDWIPPKDVILLAFVDEVHPSYHSTTANSFGSQPLTRYVEDYMEFLEYREFFDFFKGVIYPITRHTGTTDANVLQIMAAVEGRVLTHQEVLNTGTNVNVSIIETTNPYHNYSLPGGGTMKSLRSLSWKAIYNKESPAEEVFNSETFAAEINSLLDLTTSYSKEYFVTEELPIITLGDPEYFNNKCFTASFDFDNMRWISFHPYTPLYYVGAAEEFYQATADSIYVHHKQFTKFNNFNGMLSEYSIEYPIAYKHRDELLQSIQDYTIIRQYNDYQEWIQVDDVYFDEVILYNAQQCSGRRKLSPRPTSMNSYLKYPVYNTDNINITYTKSNSFYQYNTFWSVIKDKKQPIWKSSSLSPFKELNQDNMNYKKLSYQKAPLMAKDIKIRHILNSTDEYKFISQFIASQSIESFK